MAVALLLLLTTLSLSVHAAHTADRSLQAMVEADWIAQEQRLGRTPSQPQADRDALDRAEQLRASLREGPAASRLLGAFKAIENLRNEVEQAESLDDAQREALYRRLR